MPYASDKVVVDNSAIAGGKYGSGSPTVTLTKRYITRGFYTALEYAPTNGFTWVSAAPINDPEARYPELTWSKPTQVFFYTVT